MEKIREAMSLLALTNLGREASEEELFAMEQEMVRDAKWIAPHQYGRDGSMFHLESNSFYAILNGAASE
jgi:hypothetical protein